jgi:mannosyl-oligosaccharide glucosidase
MKLWDFVLPVVGGAALATAAAAGADDVSVLYQEVVRAANETLLWGPYRPNLYFGVRPRLPKSFMGGLMWANVDTVEDLQHSMSPLQSPRGHWL